MVCVKIEYEQLRENVSNVSLHMRGGEFRFFKVLLERPSVSVELATKVLHLSSEVKNLFFPFGFVLADHFLCAVQLLRFDVEFGSLQMDRTLDRH